MTIEQLKRHMDRRFDRLDKQKADRLELRRVRRELRHEITRSAERTRRHFDIVAESLRDDIKLLAEAVAGRSLNR